MGNSAATAPVACRYRPIALFARRRTSRVYGVHRVVARLVPFSGPFIAALLAALLCWSGGGTSTDRLSSLASALPLATRAPRLLGRANAPPPTCPATYPPNSAGLRALVCVGLALAGCGQAAVRRFEVELLGPHRWQHDAVGKRRRQQQQQQKCGANGPPVA